MKDKKKFGRGRIQPNVIMQIDGKQQKPAKGMLKKTIDGKKQMPGKILQVDYKMHGGKVHYKPGGGMVMDDMSKVMMKMHGGKIHDAKYYQKGAKVAGCGPARNKPNMTKKV